MLALSRASGLLTTLALAAVAHGCGYTELPMAPTPFTAGVILYEHANFLGNSAHLTGGVPDLRDFRGPCVHSESETSTRDWNDCVSSVRVAPGWRATLYRDSKYEDDALELTEDMPNLQLVQRRYCDKGGFNDCASSVRVQQH
jgi:hypothetical protein